jgi:hypothetical protein
MAKWTKNMPETVQNRTEENAVEIDPTTDPWCNKRVYKLFFPSKNEHENAIA